jgi:hypothetical protein
MVILSSSVALAVPKSAGQVFIVPIVIKGISRETTS